MLFIRLIAILLIVQKALCSAAFTATRGVQNNNYISFEDLNVLLNGEFDMSVGAFRCTRRGLYYFSFSALSDMNSHFRISLRKNRIPIVTAYSDAGGYEMASNNALMHLEHGDVVYLYVEDGKILESIINTRAFTSFSGFMIGNNDYTHSIKPDSIGFGTYRSNNDHMLISFGKPDPEDRIFYYLRI